MCCILGCTRSQDRMQFNESIVYLWETVVYNNLNGILSCLLYDVVFETPFIFYILSINLVFDYEFTIYRVYRIRNK